ncbi:Diacylglycerol kinase 5 [Camellia lanceoleosa]|uniref:Diacylglycerol kinase 5 n=1 Tax=Camellia lanceoleosa TaxID=1840588 RepID=A0ACC0I0U4_9ERIC|nr:Diacylglycerol kinase 5 [Camellia lanceoleosa]
MADYNPEFDNLKKFYIPNYIFVLGLEGKCLPDVPECPVLVFINSKSGGQLGGDLLITYSSVLNKNQVVYLLEEASNAVLHRLYLNLEKLKLNGDELALRIQENMIIIVVGGDGTVGGFLELFPISNYLTTTNCYRPTGNWKQPSICFWLQKEEFSNRSSFCNVILGSSNERQRNKNTG